MKYRNEKMEIAHILNMKDFLRSKGRDANFTSQVFHVLLKDNSEWVLKLIEEDAGIKELSEIIGEVAAYKISKRTGINIVPKTKIVIYKNFLGSLQTYIDSTIKKDEYTKLLFSKESSIEDLKLFWFIAGQWDTSEDNILFTNDGKPIAIDNANIANLQEVSKYGTPHFVRLFYTDAEDSGSIEQPIVITGSGKEVLSKLNETFNDEVPQFFKRALEKSVDKQISFTYFIKDNRVWRNFNDDKDQPDYFMEKFSRISLEKFKNIESSIFENTIVQLGNHISEDISHKMKVTKEKVTADLKRHFEQVFKGIQSRYTLANDYLNKQISSEQYPEKVAKDLTTASLSDLEITDINIQTNLSGLVEDNFS